MFDQQTQHWNGFPSSQYWRVFWRRMTNPVLERSLHAAILPPGPTHVNAVHSLSVSVSSSGIVKQAEVTPTHSGSLNTVLVAGLWASLPFDYLVKVSGKPDIQAEIIDRFPAPLAHAAIDKLLLRTLRLNCLTVDYAPLWEALYKLSFADDSWTSEVAELGARTLASGDSRWSVETPLRTDLERRLALVEIDALVSIALGFTIDHLLLMYRSQFPVLRKYESSMYFDASGRRIAKDHQAHGVHQYKEDFRLLQSYLDGGDCDGLFDRYVAFPPDDTHERPWFYKADRESEMRVAYADFAQRLALA